MWRISPSARSFLSVPHFFKKCGALSQVFPIVPHFSQLWRIFSGVPHFSDSAAFLQMWRIFHEWRIFPSVPHFSNGGAFLQMCVAHFLCFIN